MKNKKEISNAYCIHQVPSTMRKIESALHFRLMYTSCFFSTPYTTSVTLPVYTLHFVALAYTLHPPLGYFPGPVMISVTFLILLLTL
jgi:hypothetical protein